MELLYSFFVLFIGPEPVVIISTLHDVRSLSLPSKEYGLVWNGITQVHGVTSDVQDGYVFWAEKSKDKAGIFKAMLDGTSHQHIISIGIETVENVAIDWVGSHVYYTDSGRKHIVACDMYGTLCTVVISGDMDKPRGVAVNPEHRLMFWTDWGAHPHIGSAGMDGSQRKMIISSDILGPNAVIVDRTVNRIFWCDNKLNRIESARFDGSDRLIVPVEVSNPYSLDVFENMVYWSDPDGHEVHSSDKFTGKNHTILLKEGSLSPTGIHIHHAVKQPHIPNPCWNIICSHLCLLSPTNDGFQCACPVGMALNKDNRTCRSTEIRPSSIIIASFTSLYQLTHHQIGKDSVERLPLRGVENIGAVTFNRMGHTVIFSDLSANVIYSMHLETYRQTKLFDGADAVEGLDIDPYTENVYWTEVEKGTIMMGNIASGERLVLARNIPSPKAITVAPELGLMFLVEGRISHLISSWHMDGSWREVLIHIFGSVSSMVYNDRHLYFSDSIRGTIERVDVDGTNRVSLRSHLGSPVAMSVGIDSVFWLTLYSNRLNWFDKEDPKNGRGFVMDSDEDLDGHAIEYRKLIMVDHFNGSEQHVCLGHTGGCSDMCVPTPLGATCLCPVGMQIDGSNQRVCHPVECAGDDWFKCQSGCVPVSMRCNGVPDCASGEDEANCTSAEPTSGTSDEPGCTQLQFACRSGGCVSASFYCDGQFDCHDESDEPDSCPPVNCGTDEFRCADRRQCIQQSMHCNGRHDCRDGSDEPSSCSSQDHLVKCLSSQFYCPRSKMCIPQAWVCDEDKDCEFGEDEDNCYSVKSTCPRNYIRCAGHPDCIPKLSLCKDGGMADCASIPDAQLCANLNKTNSASTAPETLEPRDSCTSSQYTCYLGTNECVPLSKR